LHDLAAAPAAAWQLVLSGDPTLVGIVSLSLSISLTAVLLASALGLPLGAALAVLRFPGRNAAIVIVNALMGLPPVVAACSSISCYRVLVPWGTSDSFSPRRLW
jgi:tungstate transport system permease protein